VSRLASPTEVEPPARVPWVWLGAVGAVALGIRLWAIQTYYRELPLGFSDNFFYSVQAGFLADGKGYSDPFFWEDTGRYIASADHPPLYSTFLAVFSAMGLDGATDHRVVTAAVFGVGTVVAVGLVAHRLAGRAAAVLAAAVAALYPPLWIADGTIIAESPYAMWMALVVLVGLRLADRPRRRTAALLGALVGLAALTRSEGAFLIVLLVLPLVLVLRELPWRRRVALVATAAGACTLVILPWFVRNLARFEEPVPLAYGAGYVMKIGNCDPTYGGEMFGYWDIRCAYAGPLLPDKSVAEQRARAQAIDYISEHRDRVAAVVAARVGRIWHLYRVEQGISFDVFFERRGRWPSEAAVRAFYAVSAAAAAGIWRVRGERAMLVLAGALVASATISAALAFGITRYRMPGDVALVILAGVGLAHLSELVRRRAGPEEVPS